MTDRELLEKAAQAAGIQLHHWSEFHGFIRVDPDTDDDGPPWNPLADDGDAFRLAVKLGMFGDTGMTFQFMEAKDCEATRRAIVCAAAEIGRVL